MLKHTAVRADFKSLYMQQVADRLAVLNLPAPDLAAHRHYQAASLKERDRIAYAKEEGEKKGRAEEKLAIAKHMLKDQEPIEKIVRWTGLSEEELTSLK